MQILDKLASHKDDILRCGVGKIGLFGSFVRGGESATSDVDLLVEFEKGKKSYRNLLGFAELAERVLKRKVEVVTPQSLSPYIAPYVMREVQYVQIA